MGNQRNVHLLWIAFLVFPYMCFLLFLLLARFSFSLEVVPQMCKLAKCVRMQLCFVFISTFICSKMRICFPTESSSSLSPPPKLSTTWVGCVSCTFQAGRKCYVGNRIWASCYYCSSLPHGKCPQAINLQVEGLQPKLPLKSNKTCLKVLQNLGLDHFNKVVSMKFCKEKRKKMETCTPKLG